jgi:hypothetical protein
MYAELQWTGDYATIFWENDTSGFFSAMFGTGGPSRSLLPFVCMSSPIGTIMKLTFYRVRLRLQFTNSSPE